MTVDRCELRLTRRFTASCGETATTPVLVLDHRLIDGRLGMAYSSRWTSSLQRLRAEIER